MSDDKRDCLFFVADNAMADVIDAFLSRGFLETRIGCRDFRFNINEDMLIGTAMGGYSDGGMHMHCHALLQESGYLNSHNRVVVMFDKKFGGERPASEVREEALGRLRANGWAGDTADVVVIDPELEVWIWQDSPHVHETVGHAGERSLRDELKNETEWPDGFQKPLQPKALFREVCKRNRKGYSSSLYRDIVKKVSVKNCSDPAFQQLAFTLRRWFPVGDQV
jgi:hypothetical protein